HRRRQRPAYRSTRPHQRKPDRVSAGQGDRQRALLRQQRAAQRKNHVVGIGDEAAERALRDEMRVVVERQKDINRPRANRQRRDQAANQRAKTFGGHGRRQQETGRNGHLHEQREREIKIGRHFLLL